MYDNTGTICMTSYEYIWHHIHSLWHHTTLFITSSPLYLTSHPLHLISRPLYLCNHTHSLNDIRATICMTSHPVYLWHHIHYIYDIISTKYDITTLCVDDATISICMTFFALQMTTHTLYHTKPQYLWCHIHFRHDNTASVSDIAPTVSMSSDHLHWHLTHLGMTSHQPSVWHHMKYIYNITPNPSVITLLFLWHHSLYIWNHIQYEGNIYT